MGETSDDCVAFFENSQNANMTEEKKCIKRSRTKKSQFDLIFEFYNNHNEALIDTKAFDQLWCNLTTNLNSLGPPKYSSVGWKKVWSEHKYNKKRKRSDVEESSQILADVTKTNICNAAIENNCSTGDGIVNNTLRDEVSHPADLDDINIEELLVHNSNCFCLENVSEPFRIDIDQNLPVHPMQPNFETFQQIATSVDVSNQIVDLLSQIDKKEQRIVELFVESNNLKNELLQILKKP